MRRLFFYQNCHATGLVAFLRLNPAFARAFTVEIAHNFLVAIGNTPASFVHEQWAQADVVCYNELYHRHHENHPMIEDLRPGTKPGARLIPMSNPYNTGYFTCRESWSEDLKARLREQVKREGIDVAAWNCMQKGDLDWRKRYDDSLATMKQHEDRDGVPPDIRMSDVFDTHGKDRRLLLTLNHPSSWIFAEWARRLTGHLGLKWGGPDEKAMDILCATHPNYADLPCKDWIPPAAKLHLGLTFKVDDGPCLQVIRDGLLAL